jgi:hypothetical protein
MKHIANLAAGVRQEQEHSTRLRVFGKLVGILDQEDFHDGKMHMVLVGLRALFQPHEIAPRMEGHPLLPAALLRFCKRAPSYVTCKRAVRHSQRDSLTLACSAWPRCKFSRPSTTFQVRGHFFVVAGFLVLGLSFPPTPLSLYTCVCVCVYVCVCAHTRVRVRLLSETRRLLLLFSNTQTMMS